MQLEAGGGVWKKVSKMKPFYTQKASFSGVHPSKKNSPWKSCFVRNTRKMGNAEWENGKNEKKKQQTDAELRNGRNVGAMPASNTVLLINSIRREKFNFIKLLAETIYLNISRFSNNAACLGMVLIELSENNSDPYRLFCLPNYLSSLTLSFGKFFPPHFYLVDL